MTKSFFCCGITTKAVHHPPYPCALASRRFLAAIGGGNHVAAALVCWSYARSPWCVAAGLPTMASCRDPRLACLRQVGKKRAAGVAGPAARLSSSRVDRLAQPISYSGAKLFQPYFMNCFNCASPAVPIAIPPFRLKRQGKLVVARTRDGGKSCNGSDFRGEHPTGVRHANSGIYQGGRHVVNRAHRRTISAAPKRCPSRGAI